MTYWPAHLRQLAPIASTALLLLAPLVCPNPASASDHADTPEIADSPGTDLTDVFAFPSPENPDRIVLVMTVHPLIAAGQGSGIGFDTDVLYQFKIDRTGDAMEDLVIQATFAGTGADQRVTIRGPLAPSMVGSRSRPVAAHPVSGRINTVFSPRSGMRAFAGLREDPFFFDLERFFEIFPDRATPLTKQPVANPNTPRVASWRAPGVATDFLKDYNLLAIVVELPKADLGTGVVNLWCTTSR